VGGPPPRLRARRCRLRPGGRFAWNAFAFDHHVAARVDGVRVVDGAFAHTDHFAVGDNRVDIVLDDGATSSLWWATKNEWLGLTDVAGLEVEALYGDFDRTPFDEGSGEYVFVVRHPGLAAAPPAAERRT
jgi:hypothetical protein